MKPKLKLAVDNKPIGPSERFLSLTRNIKLAKRPPIRFEPTVKAPGDIVL